MKGKVITVFFSFWEVGSCSTVYHLCFFYNHLYCALRETLLFVFQAGNRSDPGCKDSENA